MNFLKNINWTPLNILKAVGLLLLVLVVLTLIKNLTIGSNNELDMHQLFDVTPSSMPSTADGDRGYGTGTEAQYADDVAVSEEAKLSLNNVGMPAPEPNYSTGSDAEDYEVTEYNAYIETKDVQSVCNTVSDLKDRDYVIFETANESSRSCNYRFKVEKDRAAEVLTTIEDLNPDELSEDTYTIKQQVTDYTSQLEILETKLNSINETLSTAETAYDEITDLARQTNDAESLAQVIDSKINTIERLTQQKINITAQIERLAKQKAEELDKLEYTYFNVNVREDKVVDGEYLKDSWKNATKSFVRDLNQTAQDLTINLLALLFVLVQYIIYFLIILLVVKQLWGVTKSIWNK